ncbi:hypothetical protein HMPREF0083_04174 [Aneurinibacillus aneurinilyticus ATCC 12856]|uniref:Uncharacterized protein n=1 Tax=Aneurinibacillus aneurinilyticus ATCC 12856 TaxID=649747 RepID=U1WZP1_ANEAE|nr:hypothetical protein HMPREF0083_04174 [Aneurinibacillus aneurinilyticus ATCC 12856]
MRNIYLEGTDARPDLLRSFLLFIFPPPCCKYMPEGSELKQKIIDIVIHPYQK